MEPQSEQEGPGTPKTKAVGGEVGIGVGEGSEGGEKRGLGPPNLAQWGWDTQIELEWGCGLGER